MSVLLEQELEERVYLSDQAITTLQDLQEDDNATIVMLKDNLLNILGEIVTLTPTECDEKRVRSFISTIVIVNNVLEELKK